jgi:hypothetical protein
VRVIRIAVIFFAVGVIFYCYLPIYWGINVRTNYFDRGANIWLFIQSLATIVAIVTLYEAIRSHKEISYLQNYPSIIPTTIQKAVARKCIGNRDAHRDFLHGVKITRIVRHESWVINVFDLSPLMTDRGDYPYLIVHNKGKGIATDVKMTLCFPTHKDGEDKYDFDNKCNTIEEDRVYSLEPDEIFISNRQGINLRL